MVFGNAYDLGLFLPFQPLSCFILCMYLFYICVHLVLTCENKISMIDDWLIDITRSGSFCKIPLLSVNAWIWNWIELCTYMLSTDEMLLLWFFVQFRSRHYYALWVWHESLLTDSSKANRDATSDFLNPFHENYSCVTKITILNPFKTPEVGTGKCTRTARGL